MVIFFLVYFAVLSLVFELKQNLEMPWNEPLTNKNGGITMEFYGKK